jgi:hypothetical protein
MIARIHPLMVVWHCSAPLVRKWISIYPLRMNGNLMTGEEDHYLLLLLTINLPCHRLLYRPQLVVDGNMKLVRLFQKRPEHDVSLSDGELFMVKRARYAEHLANAPQKQPVSHHQNSVYFSADIGQEIEM